MATHLIGTPARTEGKHGSVGAGSGKNTRATNQPKTGPAPAPRTGTGKFPSSVTAKQQMKYAKKANPNVFRSAEASVPNGMHKPAAQTSTAKRLASPPENANWNTCST